MWSEVRSGITYLTSLSGGSRRFIKFEKDAKGQGSFPRSTYYIYLLLFPRDALHNSSNATAEQVTAHALWFQQNLLVALRSDSKLHLAHVHSLLPDFPTMGKALLMLGLPT